MEIAIALFLVAANGFFVATEFALARVRPTQADELVALGRPGAKSVRHAVKHLDAYLSACQLGITIASLGLGAIGEPAFHDLLEPLFGETAKVLGIAVGGAVAFAIITVLHVVLGELSPKSLALARTEIVSCALAPPMRAFYLATKPLVDGFNFLGNLVLKPFGVPPASEAGHAPHSESELRELLRQSQREGFIEEDERELSEAALIFGDMRAREVMRPRAQIDYVHLDDDPREVARRAVETGRTRLPACPPDAEIEEAAGVINVKDLVQLAWEDTLELGDVLRPIARVPDALRIDEVLREMRRDRCHIALVWDEHGTVVGLLTLEDVIEQLIGDIEDEYDLIEPETLVRSGDVFTIDGSAHVRDIAQEFNLHFDAPHEATLGGELIETLGRVPEEGEHVVWMGLDVEVVEIDGPRLVTARIRAPAR